MIFVGLTIFHKEENKFCEDNFDMKWKEKLIALTACLLFTKKL